MIGVIQFLVLGGSNGRCKSMVLFEWTTTSFLHCLGLVVTPEWPPVFLFERRWDFGTSLIEVFCFQKNKVGRKKHLEIQQSNIKWYGKHNHFAHTEKCSQSPFIVFSRLCWNDFGFAMLRPWPAVRQKSQTSTLFGNPHFGGFAKGSHVLSAMVGGGHGLVMSSYYPETKLYIVEIVC